MNPITVYLDQNQWINLGLAYYRMPRGEEYFAILEKVQLASQNAVALFPLSDAHFIETGKRGDIESRKRLADLMINISQGWVLASTEYLVPNQIRAVIAEVFNQRKIPLLSAIGRGVAFAFGKSETLYKDLGVLRKEAELYQYYSLTPDGLRKILVGDNEDLLFKAVQNFTNRANLHANNIQKYRPRVKPFTKDVRKRAYVSDLTRQLYVELSKQLTLEGQNFDSFLDLGTDKLMDFFSRVPCLDIYIELETERDENLTKRVDSHDMLDVSFLSVAIPFCDIVVTEKYWSDIAKRKKLDKKYGTVILDDLRNLGKYLPVK